MIDRFLSNPCEREGCFIFELEHFTLRCFELLALGRENSELGKFILLISSKQSNNKLESDFWIVFSLSLGELIILSPPFFFGILN
ncbi:hypothetical protein BAU10_15000 [Vibrio alginolyticus]|nr:hypothetical protein BAU10_15000 [Vibrio alginolyticus]